MWRSGRVEAVGRPGGRPGFAGKRPTVGPRSGAVTGVDQQELGAALTTTGLKGCDDAGLSEYRQPSAALTFFVADVAHEMRVGSGIVVARRRSRTVNLEIAEPGAVEARRLLASERAAAMANGASGLLAVTAAAPARMWRRVHSVPSIPSVSIRHGVLPAHGDFCAKSTRTFGGYFRRRGNRVEAIARMLTHSAHTNKAGRRRAPLAG